MIPNPCIEVHTSPVDRFSVPPWFAEVVIIVQHLATHGLLDAFAHQVRLVRGRFGSYEPIDFLALLIGYAISGERTLADFFERIEPFEAAFMALFGRRCLPHRATFSRFLSAVDRPCVEAFRTLFEQQSFAEGWTSETIGGIFDRQNRRSIVFDVDATRQAARQRALPCDSTLPSARRRLDAVCAAGYTGRKRGEVVRTRTTALQIHTRQWTGTYAGRGNGDYRGELASALQAIAAYLACFALPAETALVRLDGQYGNAVVIAQLIEADVFLVTRGKGYQILEHPQIQGILTHPPTAKVISVSTAEVIELFDGGWLPMGEGLPQARVIVGRHQAPGPGKSIAVGKRIDEWVYELFITTLDAMVSWSKMSWISIMDEEPLKLCLRMKISKKIQIVGVLTPNVGKNSGKSRESAVWNLRLALGQQMQGGTVREIEWALPKEAPPIFVSGDTLSEEYGPWQWATSFGRATGRLGAETFVLQDNGMLRCPAGASLWLSEVRA